MMINGCDWQDLNTNVLAKASYSNIGISVISAIYNSFYIQYRLNLICFSPFLSLGDY